MTRQELTAYMESILPADRESMDAARRRQAELAKPPGSLGALEDMSIRLAGVLRTARPEVRRCRGRTTAWWRRAYPAPPSP